MNEIIDFSLINSFDIIIFAIIGLSTLLAFLKGFLRTVFSLIAWGSAAFLSFYFGEDLTKIFENNMSESTAKILSPSFIFIISFISISFFNKWIISIFRQLDIGFLDRTLGFAFGLLRGAIISVLLFISINVISSLIGGEKTEPDWIKNSESKQLLSYGSTILLNLTPNKISQTIEDSMKGVSINSNKTKINLANNLPINIDSSNQEIIINMLESLPKSQLIALTEKYSEKLSSLSRLEKIAFIRDVIDSYRTAYDLGLIASENKIDNIKIIELENVINDPIFDGYNKKEINQINNLINSVN